jgi:hypothetical protein
VQHDWNYGLTEQLGFRISWRGVFEALPKPHV